MDGIEEILGDGTEEQTTEEQISELFEEVAPTEEVSTEKTPAEDATPGDAETPAEETPGEETPEVTAEAKEPVAETPEASEETPAEGEGAEAPAETEVSESLAQLRAQNEALLKQIEEMSGGTIPATLAAETPTPAPKPEVAQPAVSVPSVAPQTSKVAEYMAGIDFDDISENKESFVKFIQGVLQAQQVDTTQQVLLSIPGVVGTFVQRQTAFRDVAKEFFTAHPELKRVKRYVANVANEVAANDPNLSVAEVLEKAAELSRETLKISKEVQKNAKKKASTPAGLPGGTNSGGRTPAKPSSGLQSEIDDLLTD
jgi:hypothetical protein